MVGKQKKYTAKTRVSISLDQQQGVFFHDDLIVIQGEKPLVLSSKCPHLGCRINKVEGGKLVCPCHGSSFTLNGELINGPAAHSLQKIEYTIDDERRQIVVEV